MRWISQLLCLIFDRHFKSWGHFNSQAEESSLAVAKGLQALDEAAEIEEQGEKSGCTHISHSFITLKHTWYADKYGTAWMQGSRTGAHTLQAYGDQISLVFLAGGSKEQAHSSLSANIWDQSMKALSFQPELGRSPEVRLYAL